MELKSSVNKRLRESKANYFRDLIQKNSGNSAELWKTLNEVTSHKHLSPLLCIESEGVVIFGVKTIAEILNDQSGLPAKILLLLL